MSRRIVRLRATPRSNGGDVVRWSASGDIACASRRGAVVVVRARRARTREGANARTRERANARTTDEHGDDAQRDGCDAMDGGVECAVFDASDGARARALDAVRHGLDAAKSARRLDASATTTHRFGETRADRDDGARAEKSVRALDWSAVGAMGSGERCALAMCATDGECETFAPPETTATSAWRRATRLGDAWADACASDGYARVRDGVVRVVADGAVEVRRDEDCFLRAAEVAAARAAKDARGAKAKRMKQEDPKPMDSTTLERDDVYVYGALHQGARVEVSCGEDAVPEFWRVGSVVSANFNAAARARVEYDDDNVRGEFLVWSNEDVCANGVATIPAQDRLAVRKVRPRRMTCAARPVPPRDDVRASDLQAGEIIEVMHEIPSTWRLAQVVKVENGVRVKFGRAQTSTEALVPLSACRRRQTWTGVRGGWIAAKDDTHLPLRELKYALNDETTTRSDDVKMCDILEADVDDDAKQTCVAVDEFFRLRTSDELYGESAKFDDKDDCLCERVFDSANLSTRARHDARVRIRNLLTAPPAVGLQLPKSSKTHVQLMYDDVPMLKAELLQFMSCAWMSIPCGDDADPSCYHMLACGTKSGHVVVFLIGDDATAQVVAAPRVTAKAWITGLVYDKDTSTNEIRLFIGCSDGTIMRATGAVAAAQMAFSCAPVVGELDLFTTFAALDPADGCAVTCMSITDGCLIVGKTNGDIVACNFKRTNVVRKRRVSLEPIAGACWTRDAASGALLAHVVSGATHLVLDVFHYSRDDASAVFVATRADMSSQFGAGDRRKRVDALRAVEASVGAAASPDADAVARCDAYVRVDALRTKDGFFEAKFWRGELVRTHGSASA